MKILFLCTSPLSDLEWVFLKLYFVVVFLIFRKFITSWITVALENLLYFNGITVRLHACDRSFDDGFPNLFINNAQDIRGHHVAFLASFSSPGVIFEQLSVIFALPRLFVASFTLVLPFFPTGSFERMEEEGDVATAFTMARILSNIPISRGGPTSLVIYDIHALQVWLLLSCFNHAVYDLVLAMGTLQVGWWDQLAPSIFIYVYY